jgi:glycosyltransferase involved in cell wall biosynthesis
MAATSPASGADAKRRRLLLIGPTPPPRHGVSGATALFLSDPRVAERFEIEHVDTADRRTIENIGRIDWKNIQLALGAVWRTWRLARRFRPDVCYLPISQGAPGFARDALFTFAARWSGAAVVWHLRGGYFKEFHDRAPAPLRWFIRFACRRVARVIVLGESLRRLFDGLVPKERVVVAGNGINLDEEARAGLADGWAERARRAAEAPGAIRVVYLSNLMASKGLFELLDAFKALLKEQPGARLSIAGAPYDPGIEEKLAAALRDPELRGSDGEAAAEWLGVVGGRSKWRLLGASDVFALPTYYDNEGQPWSIIEAMAARLPVLSTDHAAIAETLGDDLAVCDKPAGVASAMEGAAGLLVPKRDVDVLAEALRLLAARPELRESMGAVGAERQARLHNQDRFLEGVLTTLEAAADSSRHRRGKAKRSS